jgi:translocation and assembly module TamB
MMARRIGLAFLFALALIVLLIGAAFGLAQTGMVKRLFASQLCALLTTPEMAVEITDLQGTVPIDMRLGRIAVSDQEGVWLEVDDARLAWSPGALLRGRIRIDQLSAARIGVERLPPSEPSPEPAEPIRMPELPTWLPPTTLQQLAVGKLDLGRDVLGEPVSFTLTGQLDMPDDGDRAKLALDLERTDQRTARATVDATLQLEPPALDLSMRAQENGGLVAALTDQAEATGFDLEVVGKGPLDAWKGELRADAEGLAHVDATLGIALDDQLTLTVDGEVVPADGVLPAEVAAALGDRLGLALTVVQTGPQQLKIERLRATAANTELTADGMVDLEAERFRVGVRLVLSDLAALSGLAGTPAAGAVHLDLTADGGFLQPKGRLQLQGTGLAVAGIAADSLETSFDFAASEPLTSGFRGLSLSGSGQTEGLSAPGLAPLPLDDLSWQVDVRAPEENTIELDRLRLSMADIELTAHGQADPETLAATGQIDLTVGSLARLAEPFGQPLDGGVELHTDLVTSEQGRQIEARLNGRVDRLAGLPPGAAELLGETVDLATNVTLWPDSRVQVEDLAIEGAAVSLRGDVALSLPEQGLDGKLSLSLPRLAVLEPLLDQPIDGALDLDATNAGSVKEPDLQLAPQGRDLLLADRAIEKLA